MGKFMDLTGQRFGRLVVEQRVNTPNTHNSNWKCKCDCGNTTIVLRPSLVQGGTSSCGCLRNELISKVSKVYNQTHGESTSGGRQRATKEYKAWASMKDRCLRSTRADYSNYGGRGISICERWLSCYENFLLDMGRCPEGMSLDRKDNEKGYCPENCRWATTEEQNNNQRRNKLVSHNGLTMTISQWARKLGMKKITLWQRLRDGYSPDQAFTAPVTPNRKGLRR